MLDNNFFIPRAAGSVVRSSWFALGVVFALIIGGSAAVLFSADHSDSDSVLLLATTTSTHDSGLLDEILPEFERETGIRVQVVAVGTGQALELARRGDADVVMVHALEREQEFIEEGHGLYRRDVMFNEFVIVGPQDDPAGVVGMNVTEAMARIHTNRGPFISRGDDSGTHIRERTLWNLSGHSYSRVSSVENSDWYVSAGQGMGAALIMAAQMQGYCLSDDGTYYSMDPDLRVLVSGDTVLHNQYGVIPVVGPRSNDAVTFVDWITSPHGQQLVDGYERGGRTLFHANANTA